MKKRLLFIAILLFLVGPVFAQNKNSLNDLPFAYNLVESGAYFGRMSISCDRLSARSAKCWFSQVWLNPPDLNEINKEVAEIKKQKISKSEVSKICKETISYYARQTKNNIWIVKLNEACLQNDPIAMKNSIVWLYENVESKTCSTTLLPPHYQVFDQIDTNTWQFVGKGACATTIGTLFRRNSDSLWEYKQVRSVLNTPTCDLMSKAETNVVWSWRIEPKPLQCEYIR